MKRLGSRGVTLVELIVVGAISGILMGAAGFTVQGLRERDEMERQITQMHRDMVDARVRAFERKMEYFVTVTNNGYQITEDTNESGGTAPDRGDRVLWPEPKQLRHHSQWKGTVIMGANGIISKSTGPLIANAEVVIRFETVGIKSEYDCISVGPTRINTGKWNGADCVAI